MGGGVQYGLTVLQEQDRLVTVYSTESEVIGFVEALARELFPQCKIVEGLAAHPRNSVLGVTSIGDYGFGLAWNAIRQLCGQGWEPFQVGLATPDNKREDYFFRKRL